MNVSQNDKRLTDMIEKQRNLLDKLRDERDLDLDTVDNIQAAVHETVELDHAHHWKWWTNKSDIERHGIDDPDHPDDDLSDEDIHMYRQEEIVDIWHFVLQEAIMENMRMFHMVRSIRDTSHVPDYAVKTTDAESFRETLYEYKSGDVGLSTVFTELTKLSMNEFDTFEEIYLVYMDKNEKNKDRQDGESVRDGYDSSEQ